MCVLSQVDLSPLSPTTRHQIFVGGLDQEVNDADFRAYFAK